MSFALEWPGSELRDVVLDGDVAHVRLSAASVRADDGEHGWLAGVGLAFAGAALAGDATHAFGRIAEAQLRVDGVDHALALPASLAGAIELTLRLANGSALVLRATALQATVAEPARFTPDLSC